MKPLQIITGLLLGIIIGAIVAARLADAGMRAAILSGPYSDDYGPALSAVEQARTKLRSGNTDITPELNQVELHIRQSQQWTERLLAGRELSRSTSQRTD